MNVVVNAATLSEVTVAVAVAVTSARSSRPSGTAPVVVVSGAAKSKLVATAAGAMAIDNSIVCRKRSASRDEKCWYVRSS